MTIPTISEIRGNTILQLLTNAYNTLKNAISGKQNKLIAGDNIVINGDRISAIEGGTPVLEDYYTKVETDELLDEKADVVDVYNKTEIDTKLGAKADIADVYDKTEIDDMFAGVSQNVEIITPTLTQYQTNKISFTEELKEGDIIVCNIRDVSNNDMANFVVSSPVMQGRSTSSYLKYQLTRTSESVASFYLDDYRLDRIENTNVYFIYNDKNTISVNDNTISVGSYSSTQLSPTYSKVIIYRKKEETE